jgi:hypothetical protein
MKLQTILLLTGIAAGLTTVSCKSTEDEAEAFFGRPAPNKAKAEAKDEEKIDYDYYNQVYAHIDRRLSEFNEKEEVKLPVFSSKEVKNDFRSFSFIQNAEQISLLSIEFAGPGDVNYKLVSDRESRSFTRTIGDKEETYVFEPFTNGVPPVIPYDVHILYAFATDFNRIAETVTIRSFEKLEKGENPAIADLENEANIDENGKKKNKNFVEIKPKTTTEPLEFRIDNRWCKCYDVKLKSICAPAVSMALFVSNEEKTISRVDIILDDDSKISYIIDWREQDGFILPRVVRRLGDNAVFFRENAEVIRKGERIMQEEEPVAAETAEPEDNATEENVEIDASENDFGAQTAAEDNEDSAEVEDSAEDNEDSAEVEESAEDNEESAEDNEDSAEVEDSAEDNEDSAEEEESADEDVF